MPLIWWADGDLDGVQCRALRASMNLERRHIAVLVSATGLWSNGAADTKDVMGWERSKGRGYPVPLVRTLGTLNAAVSGLASNMVEDGLLGIVDQVATVRRPRGPHRVHQLLRLQAIGLDWSPEVIAALDEDGGDFWDRLADAAVTRAGIMLGVEGWRTQVVIDLDNERAA